jgi:hypothetical protein
LLTGMTGISLHMQWPLTSSEHLNSKRKAFYFCNYIHLKIDIVQQCQCANHVLSVCHFQFFFLLHFHSPVTPSATWLRHPCQSFIPRRASGAKYLLSLLIRYIDSCDSCELTNTFPILRQSKNAIKHA